MRNPTVCLITPNHISTNPRLVKEAEALATAGFNVHVIFTQHTDYLANEDAKILVNNPAWSYTKLNWTKSSRKGNLSRIYSGLKLKAAKYLSSVFPADLCKKIILNRHYHYQVNAAKAVNAHLYIAHNAGALAVAADAARKNKKLFAFDAEDFHRGQDLSKDILDAIISIEDKYIPKAAYLTAASPLISLEYQNMYNREVHTITNAFPMIQSRGDKNRSNSSLKLFWFSQTVGTNRGIQDVIRAMKLLESYDLEFHIYGYLPKEVKAEFDRIIRMLNFKMTPKILYKDPVPPDVLLEIAGRYDIGFATEPGFCRNNEIALSNKIFTYLVGGNAIIFSNTPAQSHFYHQHPGIGFIYEPDDVASLAGHLEMYLKDENLLNVHKDNSRKLFVDKLNWNLEKNLFLRQVSRLFDVR